MSVDESCKLSAGGMDWKVYWKGGTLTQKGRESPPPQSCKTEVLMGIWKVTGSTWLQNLTVRSVIAFIYTPELVGIHNRTGMEFAGNLSGTLMFQFQLFDVVKDMLCITSPTNAQKNDLHAAVAPPLTVAQAFTVFNFYHVHVPLVCTQLMGLSYAGNLVGPLWRAVPAA
eukprot:1160469-Pelagomonas_calceolata.AAC.6